MWTAIKRFFKDSETIAWARFHSVVGAAATAMSYVDPALMEPILTPHNFAIYLLLNGIATEYLRRRRDEL